MTQCFLRAYSESFQLDFSAPMLAVLSRFGYDINAFHGSGIHSLRNVMTLEFNVHEAFDRLDLWFEATVSLG